MDANAVAGIAPSPLAETHDVKQPAGWAEREQNPSCPPVSRTPWKTPSMRTWRIP